ncbi:MAG: GIY-YIG nuclease family protein [Planctomycetaceae bacterium]|nr:GIY-YIG nuclease family protein [Planctomycetaceae bacterium]
MHRLLEIGFQPAGHWVLAEDGIEVQLIRHAKQSNVLYAFICDGDVKYVGKTTRLLSNRLYGYRKPGSTQTTNQRNHRLIREQLAAGVAVDILVLPDNGLLHYGQFHLNLAAGLEDSIIATIQPEWNGTPTRPPVEFTEVAPPVAEFGLILQNTYFRSGFFNVGVDHERFFGGDGEQIDIFCGEQERPILGSINRRANLNSTPRIMGGTRLRDWFQEHSHAMDTVMVSVHTPNEPQINTK